MLSACRVRATSLHPAHWLKPPHWASDPRRPQEDGTPVRHVSCAWTDIAVGKAIVWLARVQRSDRTAYQGHFEISTTLHAWRDAVLAHYSVAVRRRRLAAQYRTISSSTPRRTACNFLPIFSACDPSTALLFSDLPPEPPQELAPPYIATSSLLRTLARPVTEYAELS